MAELTGSSLCHVDGGIRNKQQPKSYCKLTHHIYDTLGRMSPKHRKWTCKEHACLFVQQPYRWVCRSFIHGRSTRHQRIKSRWKQSAQCGITIFQTLQNDGHFSGDFLNRSLIQFWKLMMYCTTKMLLGMFTHIRQPLMTPVTQVWISRCRKWMDGQPLTLGI